MPTHPTTYMQPACLTPRHPPPQLHRRVQGPAAVGDPQARPLQDRGRVLRRAGTVCGPPPAGHAGRVREALKRVPVTPSATRASPALGAWACDAPGPARAQGAPPSTTPSAARAGEAPVCRAAAAGAARALTDRRPLGPCPPSSMTRARASERASRSALVFWYCHRVARGQSGAQGWLPAARQRGGWQVVGSARF